MIRRNENAEIVHVSSLGAFEFCPRAGIIKFRSQPINGEAQDEFRIPNLTYLPVFDLELLREKLNETLPKLGWSWGVTAGCTIILMVISRFMSVTLAIYLLPALLFALLFGLYHTSIFISVLSELYKYKHSPASPLDNPSEEPIEVDWWGLMKADFVAIKPKASYVDEELGLSGRPWRVLKRNVNECIPVIGYRGSNTEFSTQHLLKLAAYCHLLQSQQNAIADWGIWLDCDTRKGFAIPLKAMLKNWTEVEEWQIATEGIEKVVGDKVADKVGKFQAVLADRRRRLEIAIPHGSHCLNCPYGKPRLHVIDRSETTYPAGAIGANTLLGKNGRAVHSTCGDEFHWMPPHRYWAEAVEN